MLSTEQKENLQKLKDMADTVSHFLAEIISDKCDQATAAQAMGITPQEFSKNVGCNFVYYYKKPRPLSQATADEIQMMLESPYDKLIRDIFDITDNPGYLIDSETSEKLYSVMQKALNEREIRILTLRYGLPINNIDEKTHTYAEIAEQEHLTSERIRVICNTALRRLRKPQYSKLLLTNSDCYIASIQEAGKLKELNKCLDNEISRLTKSNHYLQIQIDSKNKLIKLLSSSNTSSEEISNTLLEQSFVTEPTYLNLPDDTDIRKLNFSTRVTNGLRRNHIFTLGDIKAKSWTELRKISTLGNKSIQELCLKLYRDYGIILPA